MKIDDLFFSETRYLLWYIGIVAFVTISVLKIVKKKKILALIKISSLY